MSLLRQIQDATIDPKFRLADILRMCKILAARLNHPPLKAWVEQELNGYRKPEQVPNYRVLKNLDCHGNFLGFVKNGNNLPIPLIALPEGIRSLLSTNYVLYGVSGLENIVSQANQRSDSVIRSPWNSTLLAWVRHDIFEKKVCCQAWTDIPTAALVVILDTVKNRVLDFVLALEVENPNAGDVVGNLNPVSPQTINYLFAQYILSNINQGTDMSNTHANHFQGNNFGNVANEVNDNAQQRVNQYGQYAEEKKTLAELAKEIQDLLKQLEQTNSTATEDEQIAYINDKTSPSFKRRAAGALRAVGEAVLDEFILDNKYLKVAKATVKAWCEPNS